MSKPNPCLAWIKRNHDDLMQEYRAYGLRNDYSPDGVMGFEAWARNEYRIHVEYNKARQHTARCWCFLSGQEGHSGRCELGQTESAVENVETCHE